MAWEQRGNGRYYYRKRWEGGRCVSDYLGAGATAQLLAGIAAGRRAEATQERQAEQERRRQQAQGSQAVKALAAELRTLTHAILISNGYHQHKRQWRKRMKHPLQPGEYMTMVPTAPPVDPAEVKRGLRALQEALNITAHPTGKRATVTELDEARAEQQRRSAVQQVLRDYPCIWASLRASLTGAEDALIKARGCDPASPTGQIAHHTLKAMRDELGYAHAPLLEQLLIEHVVLTWFDHSVPENNSSFLTLWQRYTYDLDIKERYFVD